MIYEDFVEQVTELVRRIVTAQMTERAAVTIQRVLKNNNTVKIAICILEPDSNVSPTIYLEGYYEKWQAGQALAALAEEIVEEYRHNSSCRFLEVQRLARWEDMKEHTACKLIHAERNQELLADLPHRYFLDCALVYYLELSDPMIGEGTALIHNRQLEMWQITEEELYRQAYDNTQRKHGCRIRSLNQIMREMIRRQLCEMTDTELPDTGLRKEGEAVPGLAAERMEEELCSPRQDSVYLMTNQDQYFGAVTLIYEEYLHRFADRFPNGFYVIPSSIHEVLLIPEEAGFTPEELSSLIQTIHADLTQEDPQSALSDRVYYYAPKTGILTCLPPDYAKREKEFTESTEFGS